MDRKITLVGVGALGSHVALLLRNEATLKVIDHDRVEQKNTLSQFYGRPGVGKSKAQALQQELQFFFASKIEAIPHKLTANNDLQLLGETDLIIDCLDNKEARQIVQNFARSNRIPCLHGALAADGGFGRVVWDERFVIDEGVSGGATCEDGLHLPFIVLVSACIARAAQEFLHRGKKNGFEITPVCGVIRT